MERFKLNRTGKLSSSNLQFVKSSMNKKVKTEKFKRFSTLFYDRKSSTLTEFLFLHKILHIRASRAFELRINSGKNIRGDPAKPFTGICCYESSKIR